MAGGDTNQPGDGWPEGGDALHMIVLGPINVVASKTKDYIFDAYTLQFACTPIKGEITHENVDISNAMTINIQDDSSTPKQIVTDQTVPAITGGAGATVALTVIQGVRLNAGAILEASYGSGASDTSTGTKIRLWVKAL